MHPVQGLVELQVPWPGSTASMLFSSACDFLWHFDKEVDVITLAYSMAPSSRAELSLSIHLAKYLL